MRIIHELDRLNMISPQFKIRLPASPPQTFFLVCALLIIVFNAVTLYKKTSQLGQIRQQIPFLFLGNKFLGLKEILKNPKYLGYYTDNNLDENKAAMQFAQAQYILAPIILDLNNTDHPFVLFDCSREEIAMQKIKEAGLVPIKRNQFGIILAGHLKKSGESEPKQRLRIPLWSQHRLRSGTTP